MTADPGGPVGSLAEEAARLVAALHDWSADGSAGRAVDHDPAAHAPECQWCPLCRVVHAVTQISPEVRQHLAAAATSLLQAAATVLDTTYDAGVDRSEPREGDEPTP